MNILKKSCLFSFMDVYNFYYLTDDERVKYENELIIIENFIGEERKNIS